MKTTKAMKVMKSTKKETTKAMPFLLLVYPCVHDMAIDQAMKAKNMKAKTMKARTPVS